MMDNFTILHKLWFPLGICLTAIPMASNLMHFHAPKHSKHVQFDGIIVACLGFKYPLHDIFWKIILRDAIQDAIDALSKHYKEWDMIGYHII